MDSITPQVKLPLLDLERFSRAPVLTEGDMLRIDTLQSKVWDILHANGELWKDERLQGGLMDRPLFDGLQKLTHVSGKLLVAAGNSVSRMGNEASPESVGAFESIKDRTQKITDFLSDGPIGERVSEYLKQKPRIDFH